MKLEDMSPALKARVEEALARQSVRAAQDGPQAKGAERVTRECRAGTIGPNKTETEYNRLYLHGKGIYEALTLRLPGGSRYTPDWVLIGAVGAVELHEVKGSYRFGSHGRAATAFREAVAAFPCVAFVWAVRGKGGAWSVRRHVAGSAGGFCGAASARAATHTVFFPAPTPTPSPDTSGGDQGEVR